MISDHVCSPNLASGHDAGVSRFLAWRDKSGAEVVIKVEVLWAVALAVVS